MNATAFEGDTQKLTGNVKEVAGAALGNDSLRGEGVADQVVGTAKQAAGAAREAIANPGPVVEKAKSFAKERPYAAAALIGVVGLAILNTLRGKR
ncbi:CsbD family protein [Sphingomonas sp. Leaf343]|uniref:CsbD family protein n=1 Tax=Sphingomonas sp. Leaf343 TaxID=1736345 RepID=UPI0006FD45EC|nr:CsbD family protein [Sphingomonas sp. Leaf343]KQR80443.1 general stress protein CsbD [Sphingomonas sp. Leaf343]